MFDINESYARAGVGTPRPFQESAWISILAGQNTVISAGTGSGKTEAALLPALETGRRIVVLYPTKALLQDQRERVGRLATGKTISVDTGDDDDHRFYHSDIILTSIDKFLFRFFGYGKKRWSYLYPYRIALASDRPTVLILDEAHAYEDVAFSHMWFLLKKLTYERRVQTVLLSATLAPTFLEAMDDPSRQYFPRGSDEGRFFEKIEDHENRSGALIYRGLISASDVVRGALEFFDQGKRVIIVARRVVPSELDGPSEEIAVHGLWESFGSAIKARDTERTPLARLAILSGDAVEGNILTYHGHQMPDYRRRVLERLKTLDESWQANGRDRVRKPFVLLTTSAMEVGVDISCDVMITDLCEPDSFVQRVGRCARRSGETGEVYLVAPGQRRISRRAVSLWDRMRDQPPGVSLDAGVKKELNRLNLVPDLNAVPQRLEYLQNLSLHRYVYDFVEENRELWEKGILITRDWEPSIPVVRGNTSELGDCIGGIPEREFWCGKELKEKLLLPVSGAAEIAPFCAWVFEGYNEGNQYIQRVALGGATDRSLVDALRFAGLNPKLQKQNESNKVRAVYGLDLPLILILPSVPDLRQKVFPSDELGLVYRKRRSEWAAKTEVDKMRWPGFTRSPNDSLLRSVGTILRKASSQTELPVYWFEPTEENP